jgi:transcriptional regulator with XRE-family HTH domain
MSTRGRRNEPTAAGQWLRRQREQRGIASQSELARRLGWDKTAVNNYETRGVTVPDDRAEQLAEFFDLDILTVRRNLGLWAPKESAMDRAERIMDENERLAAELVERVKRLKRLQREAVDQVVRAFEAEQAPPREPDNSNP